MRFSDYPDVFAEIEISDESFMRAITWRDKMNCQDNRDSPWIEENKKPESAGCGIPCSDGWGGSSTCQHGNALDVACAECSIAA